MRGVAIHDLHPRGFLAFDLKDILRCLGKNALERTWTIAGIECTGEATEEFEALERSNASVEGSSLASLADRTNQVIWGDFRGRYPGEATESLLIKAIDSTVWEVFGDDDCLGKIRTAFKDVRPAATDAG
jgi:hypothetical protein